MNVIIAGIELEINQRIFSMDDLRFDDQSSAETLVVPVRYSTVSLQTNTLHNSSISPVQNFIQCLVGVFIALDPLHEVLNCLFWITVGVVGAAQLHLLNRETAKHWWKLGQNSFHPNAYTQTHPATHHNVLLYDIWVFTHRLYEEHLREREPNQT